MAALRRFRACSGTRKCKRRCTRIRRDERGWYAGAATGLWTEATAGSASICVIPSYPRESAFPLCCPRRHTRRRRLIGCPSKFRRGLRGYVALAAQRPHRARRENWNMACGRRGDAVVPLITARSPPSFLLRVLCAALHCQPGKSPQPAVIFRCTARNALFRLNLFPQGSWRVGYRIEARKGNRKKRKRRLQRHRLKSDALAMDARLFCVVCGSPYCWLIQPDTDAQRHRRDPRFGLVASDRPR